MSEIDPTSSVSPGTPPAGGVIHLDAAGFMFAVGESTREAKDRAGYGHAASAATAGAIGARGLLGRRVGMGAAKRGKFGCVETGFNLAPPCRGAGDVGAPRLSEAGNAPEEARA